LQETVISLVKTCGVTAFLWDKMGERE